MGNGGGYKFRFANRIIRESAKTKLKTLAKGAEKRRRRELDEAYNGISKREERFRTVGQVANDYLEDYKLRHRSTTFAEYALKHVTRLLGAEMVVDISDKTVKRYQTLRLKEKASVKSINEEVGFLLRLLEDRGEVIRSRMKREKTLKLKGASRQGKAYASEQKAALMQAATIGQRKRGEEFMCSPFIKPALALAFNTGMRNGEIRNLTWDQINFSKRILTVGRSKSEAGTGRTIPLNAELYSALQDHADWYTQRFGSAEPEWYVFPARKTGKTRPYDPTRPVGTLKTAWRNIKKKTGVKGRWHDTRHTLVTELAESGAGEQTIMEIAGHSSRAMIKRYSHISMEAKRKALDTFATGAVPPVAQNVAQSSVPGSEPETDVVDSKTHTPQ